MMEQSGGINLRHPLYGRGMMEEENSGDKTEFKSKRVEGAKCGDEGYCEFCGSFGRQWKDGGILYCCELAFYGYQ